MKLTIPRKDLAEGLGGVTRVVRSNTSLPVIRNVLLDAGADTLKLGATDLELGVEVRAPAAVATPGAVTVPARTIQEIVAALPEADVGLETTEGAVRLTCGRADYSIHTLPAEDFPAMPEVAGDVRFEVPALLKETLAQTMLACSRDETRPMLCGVLWRLEAGLLSLVATNTHVLAVRSSSPPSASGARDAIVPFSALTELAHLLTGAEGEVTAVRMDANQAQFASGRWSLVTRLVDGQFPNYGRVIPASHTRRVVADRDELMGALRRARIVAREAAAAERVLLAVEGDALTVRAEAGDLGRASEAVECVADGEFADFTIAFNAVYLLDVLKVIGAERVALEMTEPLSPAVLRPAEGSDYLVTVMPMSLTN